MPDRIDTPFTGEHFAEFCKKMLGQPYWYGTCLYRCTKDLAKRKAAQYPAHYFAERNDQYYEDVKEKRVCADCVGAVKGYAWTNGGKGVLESIGTGKEFVSKYGSNGCPDKSANGMFSYAKSKGMPYGKIGTLPEIIGLALHKDGHIGYYIGGGYAVEWRGFKYGCVKTKVTERGWKYWYKLPFIDYADDISTDKEYVPQGGKTVTVISNGGTVNIRRGNGTQYEKIAAIKPGTSLPYVATAENSWHAVVIGNEVGWISGDYSKIE